VLPQRVTGGADSPSTISLKQASTIAEMRTGRRAASPGWAVLSDKGLINIVVSSGAWFAPLGLVHRLGGRPFCVMRSSSRRSSRELRWRTAPPDGPCAPARR
jgi:hypothetical protein